MDPRPILRSLAQDAAASESQRPGRGRGDGQIIQVQNRPGGPPVRTPGPANLSQTGAISVTGP